MKIQKNIIIFLNISCLLNLIAFGSIKGKFNLVKPKPPFCIQKSDLLCASTAGAMVMKYWAKVDVVLSKDCETYQKEFRTCFGTDNGDTQSFPIIMVCFQKVMKKNYKKHDEYINNPYVFYSPIQYDEILKLIKFSQVKDSKSPWDRPAVLDYSEDVDLKSGSIKYSMHAVCLYGCRKTLKKNVVKYEYKILDGKYKETDRRHIDTIKYQSVLTDDQIKDKVIFCWPIKCKAN